MSEHENATIQRLSEQWRALMVSQMGLATPRPSVDAMIRQMHEMCAEMAAAIEQGKRRQSAPRLRREQLFAAYAATLDGLNEDQKRAVTMRYTLDQQERSTRDAQ